MKMFKLLAKEEYLDVLIEELKEFGLKEEHSEVRNFFKNQYYTVVVCLERNKYQINESRLNEKVLEDKYEGQSFINLIPKERYYIKESEQSSNKNVSVIGFDELLASALREKNYTNNEIRLLSKDIVLDNYFNDIKRSYSENQRLINRVWSAEDVYEKIKNNEEVYRSFINFRKKAHEINRLKEKMTDEPIGHLNFKVEEVNESLNSADFIRKIIRLTNLHVRNVRFKVQSMDGLLNTLSFLGEEDYSYVFQNTNEEVIRYDLAVLEVEVSRLLNNDYFTSQGIDYYENKIFDLNIQSKKLSFWEETGQIGDKTEYESRGATIVR